MASSKISRLCQSVLPAEFEQIKRQAPGLQHFLEENLPESVRQSVTVLTINQNEIVIAANSPMVANFLRLHSKELQQQIRETFDFEQTLKFRTVPESLLQLQRHSSSPQSPRQVSPESVDALERNAQWIEDEGLKAAMLSLAESLKPS
jgi:sRNA-binding carbon storage regulator CsrA